MPILLIVIVLIVVIVAVVYSNRPNQESKETTAENKTGEEITSIEKQLETVSPKIDTSIGNNIAEYILAILAYALLFIGIFTSIILTAEMEEIWVLFAGIISTVICWAALMVTVNISNNIRTIKKLLANKQQ